MKKQFKLKLNKETTKKYINYGLMVLTIGLGFAGVEAVKKASDTSIKEVTSLCDVENKNNEWIRIRGFIKEESEINRPILEDSNGCSVVLPKAIAIGKKEMTAFIRHGEVSSVDNIFDNPNILDPQGNLEPVISTTITFNADKSIPWGAQTMNLIIRVPLDPKVGYCPEGYGNYNHKTYRMDCKETLVFPIEMYKGLKKGKEYKIYYTEGTKQVRNVEEM